MSDSLTTSNILTGAFLLIAILCFSGLMVFLQGYDPDPIGTPYTIRLDSAPGILRNSPVTVGGLRVGSVEAVDLVQVQSADETGQLRRRTQVLVTARIEPKFEDDFTVYQNATASVVTAVFGRASLALNPGGPGSFGNLDAPALPFPEGAVREIKGISTPGLDDLSRRAIEITDSVTGLLGDVRRMVQDLESSGVGETNREVQRLLQSISQRVDEASPVMSNLDAALASARRTLEAVEASAGQNSETLAKTLQNVESITAKTDRFVGEHLEALATRLETALAEVSALASSSRGMIEENRSNFRATMGYVRDIASQLRDMAGKLRRDPSILLWGTSEKASQADREPRSGTVIDEARLRDTGALPVRERD
jgi:ABC-type transporter Mla subunit MlaD